MILECQSTSGPPARCLAMFLLGRLYPRVGEHLLLHGPQPTVIQALSFITTQPSSIPLSGQSCLGILELKLTKSTAVNGLAKYGIQLMLLDKQKVVLSSRAIRPVMRMLWLRVLASVKLVRSSYAHIP